MLNMAKNMIFNNAFQGKIKYNGKIKYLLLALDSICRWIYSHFLFIIHHRIEHATIHTLYYNIIISLRYNSLWLIQILWIIKTLEPVSFIYMYVHIFIFISSMKLFTSHVLKDLTGQPWPFYKIIISALFFSW